MTDRPELAHMGSTKRQDMPSLDQSILQKLRQNRNRLISEEELNESLDYWSDKQIDSLIESLSLSTSQTDSSQVSSEEDFSYETDSSISLSENVNSSIESDSEQSFSLCLSLSSHSTLECDRSIRSNSEVDSQTDLSVTSLSLAVASEDNSSALPQSDSAISSGKDTIAPKESIVSENDLKEKKSIVRELVGNQCFGLDINKMKSFRQRFYSSGTKWGSTVVGRPTGDSIDAKHKHSSIEKGFAKGQRSDAQLDGCLLRKYPKV